MGLFRESVSTLRLYLIIAGVFGAAITTTALIASGASSTLRLVFAPTLIVSIAYLGLGITLPTVLSRAPGAAVGILGAAVGVDALMLTANVLSMLSGKQMGVGPVIALLFALYLFVNVRRLAAEHQAMPPSRSR